MRICTLSTLAVLLSLVAACGPSLRGTVERERLLEVVERDAIFYQAPPLPTSLLERLRAHRLVVVGEYHDITHHDALVGELAVALAADGFGTVLLEFPQAYDWLIDGYARGFVDTPGEGAVRTYGALLDRIRQLNRGLPADERVRVHAIDVNLQAGDFLPPFRGLLHQIGLPERLLELVAALEGGDDPAAALASAQADLATHEEGYRAQWGEAAYDAVADALHAEALSVEVRRMRSGAAQDRAREEVMHALVERQLAAARGGVLLNVGYLHAQKHRQTGTVDVWLAERLIGARPLGGDEVYALVVVPASGEKLIRGRVRAFDVGTESPANELFRVLQEVADGAHAFLPLDDPLFREERVVVNYLPELRVGPPHEVFDAFVLLPEVEYAGQ